jgi:hypothetical protein
VSPASDDGLRLSIPQADHGTAEPGTADHDAADHHAADHDALNDGAAGEWQSHQPLPFALFAISSHKQGKTASKTTVSRTKRTGVADVTNESRRRPRLGDVRAPAVIPASLSPAS